MMADRDIKKRIYNIQLKQCFFEVSLQQVIIKHSLPGRRQWTQRVVFTCV